MDTSLRERPIRRVSHVDFLGYQKGLHHFMTHFWMLVKQEMILGPCQETSFSAITLKNPESNFARRKKIHSFFPVKYIDASRTMHTDLDLKQEKRIDDSWNIYWSRDLSDSMDRFHCENLQTDIFCLGGDWQNAKGHPGQIIYCQNSGWNWQEMLSWGRNIDGQLKRKAR